MNETARFFIIWGPTFLFILTILTGFLVGFFRGFRKSLILMIHMLVVGCICLGIYIGFANQPDLDYKMVSFINGILNKFGGNSLQDMLQVAASHDTLHGMLAEKIVSSMSEEELMRHLILDNMASISAIVEMAYRLVLFVIMAIFYLLLIFLFYLIYLIAYPVRRTKRKYNQKFEKGETSHPYKKRRLFGGLIGTGRALIVGVIGFSFLGALIWVVTGGEAIPSRDEIKENGETVSFEDEKFNEIYDYYSVVCKMSDTGIFKVLNGIHDPSNTPFYFYISDLVLQGKIQDEEMGVNEKFYFRDEVGEYVSFVKKSMALILKYASADELKAITSSNDTNNMTNALISILNKNGFSQEFSTLIDEFEAKPFMSHLCLSSLTSLVNHIDLAVKDEKIIGLVNVLFKSENSIKVTDLATEADVKNLFKAVINVVSESNDLLVSKDEINVKELIGCAKGVVPTIQQLSLFNDRKDYGNRLISNLYQYCAENFVEDDINLPEVGDEIVWVDEFNILLKVATPILEIGYEVYDKDNTVMIDHLLTMFKSTNPKHEFMEQQYDLLSSELSKSELVNVVFKSSYVGKTIDDMIVSMTSNEKAGIPKDIDYRSEVSVLLQSLKSFLKNDGDEIYYEMTDNQDITGEKLAKIFELLGKDVDGVTLMDKLLESKLLHYALSSFIVYSDFGEFKIYAPNAVITEIEGYRIVQQEEISKLADIIVSCSDIITKIVDEPDNIDYAELITNQNLLNALDGENQSLLLKGTIANLIIQTASTSNMLVIPFGYDDPEEWLKEDTDEIGCIIKSIKNIVNEESGKELINGLLSSEGVKPKLILDISMNSIKTLFGSKVLRYTVSNTLQTIDLGGFELVIPATELEEKEALTTTDTKVNVIKEASLVGSIEEIKKIIEFDENDNPSIHEPSIFTDKKSIVENGILHATIINLLVQLSVEDNSAITVPEDYVTALEEIKTSEDLTGNVWFAEKLEDREIYVLLEIVEGFIKDPETSEIDPNFSFESDFSSQIKITQPTIDNLCKSVIINASISKEIVRFLPTPAELYVNDLLDRTELKMLFDCSFKILHKDTLAISDLQNLTFDTMALTKSDLLVVDQSQILMATVSNYFEESQDVYIPQSVTKEQEIIPIDTKTKVAVLTKEEYDAMIDNLFEILADESGSLTIKNITVDNIKIKESTMDKITTSAILSATLSKYMTDSKDIIIPKLSASKEMLTNGNEAYIIHHTADNNELGQLLHLMMNLFGTTPQGATEKELDVKHVDTSNLVIDSTSKNLVVESLIMRATVSNYLTTNEEQGIIIPNDDTIIEDVDVVNNEQKKSILTKIELDSLLDIAFDLFAEEDKLNVSHIQADSIVITKENAPIISQSEIINATIVDNLLDNSDIIIPSHMVTDYLIINETSKMCYVIQQQSELESFLCGMIDMIGENGKISTGSINIGKITIDQNVANSRSTIIHATLGSKLMGFEELVIPTSVVLEANETITKEGKASKVYLETSELSLLLNELILVAGNKEEGQTTPTKLVMDTLNPSESISSDHLKITKTLVENEEFLKSEILNTTISTYVTTENVVVKNDPAIVHATDVYTSNQKYILVRKETKMILLGMMALLEQEELTVQSVSEAGMDNITLTPEKMNVIYQSTILTDTISSKLCQTENLEKPYQNVLELTSIENNAAYVIEHNELSLLFNAIFCLTNNEISIVNGSADIDVSSLEITSENLPTLLASDVFKTTMSKELFIDSIYIPDDVNHVVERAEIFDLNTDAHHRTDTVIQTHQIEDVFKGLYAFLNKNTIAIEDIAQVNYFKAMPNDSQRIDIILNSTIINTTIGHTIMNTDFLKKPTSIWNSMDVWNGTTFVSDTSIVVPVEVGKVFDALLVTLPSTMTEINFEVLQLRDIQLPTVSSDADIIVQSDVLAATISDKVMAMDSKDIVILDECQDTYGTLEVYLNRNDLSKLLLAFSIGLGKTNAEDISFTTIPVPKAGSKEEKALLDSLIIRATLSRTIMGNETVKVFETSTSFMLKKYQQVECIIFNDVELKQLIKGIDLLYDSPSFSSIDLDVQSILLMDAVNKHEILNVISVSDIYRSMMSEKLMASVTGSKRMYEILTTSAETQIIDNEPYVYVFDTMSSKYHIQNPTSGINVLSSFEGSGKQSGFSLFTKRDIQALEFVA